MTRGVSVINNYAPPSAIYRYAFSLKRCLPGMVSVANICAHPSEFSGSWEDGVELGFSLRSRYSRDCGQLSPLEMGVSADMDESLGGSTARWCRPRWFS